ncbi:LamG domain-containing protein [Rariglobus hedericola]|uniref:LamG domain-containing protein n=1 Tax=Rariglobus hedericola TaxID=2597822 RepID=A0A556QN33_9BACT|nr:LamG domain-containing protein [Rariglobus hedericola]TSJ78056.1 LamG domain-containing protein [Rariglobus hedericola]
MNSFLTSALMRALFIFTVGLLANSAGAQTLLSHYKLDGNGTDFGTLAVNGTTSGAAAFTNTGAGVGVFDKALRVGTGATDHFVAPTANNSAYALSAITIALWVNVDTASMNDRLVSTLTGTNGFDLYMGGYTVGGGSGGADLFNLTFVVNGTSGGVSSTSATYVSDKWLFLAVTYSANTALFYSGDLTTAASLKSTLSYAGGSIVASSADLEIGGTPATTNDRTPTALFNDVRIYSGALTALQLEAVRASTIPEPSQTALASGLLAFAFLIIQARRRRC